MDDIYARSPLMGVSNPTDFVHQVHVGFDPISGAFTGLPEQWTRLLTSSAITKEDYAKNPQAVLDVLEFYTDIQKRGERDDYGLGGAGMGPDARQARSPSGAPPARFGAGTGLAGQRSDSLNGSTGLSPNSTPSQTQAFSGVNNNSRPSQATQLGFRQAPGPPPRQFSDANLPTSTLDPSRDASGRAIASTRTGGSRPHLIPGRAAPPAPSPAPGAVRNDIKDGSSLAAGLKPLLTSSASRTTVKGPLAPSISGSKPALSSSSTAPKPLQLTMSNKPSNAALSPPSGLPKSSTAAPSAASKPLQAIQKAEGDRRISTMSEAQIMTKLRSVCSPQDPNTLYSKIKKVGQGASGSVYVARVLASGAKVAIKQMDLSHQPRKELIVNEILVMKESQHPNIVNFLDSFLVKGAELWVVMEFMEGGALTDVIDSNSLEEEQIASISNEVSSIPAPPLSIPLTHCLP
jgi:hypothetical protein